MSIERGQKIKASDPNVGPNRAAGTADLKYITHNSSRRNTMKVKSNIKRALAGVSVAVAVAVTAGAAGAATTKSTHVSSAKASSAVSSAAATRSAARSAFQGGFDRDHWWIKVGRGEVIADVTNAVCRRYSGPFGPAVCPWISNTARQIIRGNAGVWAEVYTNGRVRIGTW